MNQVKGVLINYMSRTDAEEFIKAINAYANSFVQESNGVDKLDKTQIEYSVPNGVNDRVIVDKVITLAEVILPKENYCNLLLDLAQLMNINGNNNFALEILENLKNGTGTKTRCYKFRGDANLLISKIYWQQAQWEDCEFYLTEAYNEFREILDFVGYAKCENMYGTLYGEKGDFEKAIKHFETALEYLDKKEDHLTHAMIMTNMGVVYTIYEDFEKAIWNYKNAAEKFELLRDQNRLARVYHNIGMLYSRMKEYDNALEQFNNSITISLEYNYLSNSAISYIGKAFIYTKMGNNELANAFTDKAMEIACRINDALSIADIYRIKGIIHSNLNDFNLSEEFFENSIRLNDDLESSYNKTESSKELDELLNKKSALA